jgi:nitroreductase
MDFGKLAAARYSVRKFKNILPEKDLINSVLDAGRIAPTAANRQPQRILVITSQKGLAKVDECTVYRFQAPVVFLVCYDKSVCWVRPFDKMDSGQVDSSIAATQMMLQAADIGLGTTWVMNFDPEKTRKAFCLPDNFVPAVMLIMGYPAEDAVPAARHSERNDLNTMAFYDNFL